MGGVGGQDLMALDLDSSEAKKQKRFRTEQKGTEQCSVRPPVTGLEVPRPVTSTGRWLNGVPLSSCSSRQPSE